MNDLDALKAMQDFTNRLRNCLGHVQTIAVVEAPHVLGSVALPTLRVGIELVKYGNDFAIVISHRERPYYVLLLSASELATEICLAHDAVEKHRHTKCPESTSQEVMGFELERTEELVEQLLRKLLH